MSDRSFRSSVADEDYAYATTYFYFHKAIDVVAQDDPEKQCESMNNFNVAWELRDDALSNGRAVLALPGARLSGRQREEISHFLAELEALPASVVKVNNVKSEHLRVMTSSFWSSLREVAKKLRIDLESETNRVNLILWPSNSSSVPEN